MPRRSSIAPPGTSRSCGRIHGIEQPLPADVREALAQLLAQALIADLGRKNEDSDADGQSSCRDCPKAETDTAEARDGAVAQLAQEAL